MCVFRKDGAFLRQLSSTFNVHLFLTLRLSGNYQDIVCGLFVTRFLWGSLRRAFFIFRLNFRTYCLNVSVSRVTRKRHGFDNSCRRQEDSINLYIRCLSNERVARFAGSEVRLFCQVNSSCLRFGQFFRYSVLLRAGNACATSSFFNYFRLLRGFFICLSQFSRELCRRTYAQFALTRLLPRLFHGGQRREVRRDRRAFRDAWHRQMGRSIGKLSMDQLRGLRRP